MFLTVFMGGWNLQETAMIGGEDLKGCLRDIAECGGGCHKAGRLGCARVSTCDI